MKYDRLRPCNPARRPLTPACGCAPGSAAFCACGRGCFLSPPPGLGGAWARPQALTGFIASTVRGCLSGTLSYASLGAASKSREHIYFSNTRWLTLWVTVQKWEIFYKDNGHKLARWNLPSPVFKINRQTPKNSLLYPYWELQSVNA